MATPDAREAEVASRVAAGLLHEFRNVLNPIVSAAWLLEANANDPSKVIELAHRINGFAKAERRSPPRLVNCSTRRPPEFRRMRRA